MSKQTTEILLDKFIDCSNHSPGLGVPGRSVCWVVAHGSADYRPPLYSQGSGTSPGDGTGDTAPAPGSPLGRRPPTPR